MTVGKQRRSLKGAELWRAAACWSSVGNTKDTARSRRVFKSFNYSEASRKYIYIPAACSCSANQLSSAGTAQPVQSVCRAKLRLHNSCREYFKKGAVVLTDGSGSGRRVLMENRQFAALQFSLPLVSTPKVHFFFFLVDFKPN